MLKKMIMLVTLLTLLGICFFIWYSLYQEMIGTKSSNSNSNSNLTLTKEQLDNFSGNVYFTSDFKEEFIAIGGFSLLGKKTRQGISSVYEANVFGAQNAKIRVKDASGKIIGLFQADEKGDFNFNTEKSNYYQLEIVFDETKIEMTLPHGKTQELNIFMGHELSGNYLEKITQMELQNKVEKTQREPDTNSNNTVQSEVPGDNIREFIVLQDGQSVNAFYTAKEAIDFAKNLDSAEVVNPNVVIWDNKPSRVYQYDKHLKDFPTKVEAIEFANQYDHAKVVNLKTGKVEYDNYPRECGMCDSPIQHEY